jgi:N-terminal acetyltransferase B complex non-catalytic subunit
MLSSDEISELLAEISGSFDASSVSVNTLGMTITLFKAQELLGMLFTKSTSGLPLSKIHLNLFMFFYFIEAAPFISFTRLPEILYANPELQGIVKRLVDTFYRNLPLSNDLDPQESMFGEELLSMASSILVQVCRFI